MMPDAALPKLKAADVVRILEEGVEDGAYIATDADGTLWSGDVGEDFLRGILAHGDIRDEAVVELRSLANSYGVRSDNTAPELARGLFHAYEEGRFPEDRCCALIASLSAGWSESELARFCVELAESVNIRDRIHPELLTVLSRATSLNMPIAVVSASPVGIVRAGISAIGLRADRVLAVEPVFTNGKQTIAIREPMPYDAGKVAALVEAYGDRRCVFAFGDNAFDVPMLRHARFALAVRPKGRLLARQHEVSALRQLAE